MTSGRREAQGDASSVRHGDATGNEHELRGDDAHGDAAVRPHRRSEIVLGELARQVQRLGVDPLDIARRVYVCGQCREHDHAENRGDEHADAEGPQQFGTENSSLAGFRGLLRHGLPHRSAWKEDEQINRQVAEHQQGDSGAGQDAGAKRHHAHDLGERGLIDLIGDLGRNVGSRSLIGRDHRLAPTAAPQRLRSRLYTMSIRRPADVCDFLSRTAVRKSAMTPTKWSHLALARF